MEAFTRVGVNAIMLDLKYIFFILDKLEKIAPEIKSYILDKINDESLDKIKQSLVSK